MIFVIIHGAIGNEFWNTWYEGAYNALPPNTAAKLVYLRTGYSIPATANYLDRACSEADGVIISVPYADEASRRSIADRINSCLEQKPDKPYLLTNTDTAYDMTEYFSSGSRLSATFDGYIGSANYDMGTTCTILAVTKSMDSAISGVLPTADAVDSSMKIAVYWSENEQDNAGIEQRKEGIYQAVQQIGGMDQVKVRTTVSEIRSLLRETGHYVIALGTGAASELQQAGVSVDLQCGDDVDRGQLSFYGQSTYTQGLQAAGQMYAYLIRPTDGFGEEGSPSANLLPGAPQQTVGVVGVDSGEYEVVSPPYEPAFQQPSCPLKLAVITHAPTTDDIPPSPRKDADTFWEIWYVGSEDSKQDFDMTWYALGSNAASIASEMAKECDLADAIVITVPFEEGSPNYTTVDNAIKACQDKRPYLLIVTTNTDTYHNPKVISYVGSDNFHIGKMCSYAAFSADPQVFLGITEPTPSADLIESTYIIAYVPAVDSQNPSVLRRFEGIVERLKEMGFPEGTAVKATSVEFVESSKRASNKDNVIIMSLTFGGLADLACETGVTCDTKADFSCGDNLGSTDYYGQHVWSQGAGAVMQALTAARAKWIGAVGNADSVQKPVGVQAPAQERAPFYDPFSYSQDKGDYGLRYLCTAGTFPVGISLEFDVATEFINNLGGIPGGPTVECTVDATDGIYPPGGPDADCPCGCGCVCSDPSSTLPKELRYKAAGKYYDGKSHEPMEFDLVLTNLTHYKPFNSKSNGRGLADVDGLYEHSFADVSMAAGTETYFLLTAVFEGGDINEPSNRVPMDGGATPQRPRVLADAPAGQPRTRPRSPPPLQLRRSCAPSTSTSASSRASQS